MFKYSELETQPIVPKQHKKIGQTYVFYSKNGKLIYTIGPHWPFFVAMFSLIFVLGSLCTFCVVNKMGISFQIATIVLTIMVLVFYGLTAIKDPGIIFSSKSEDSEKEGELRMCRKCGVECKNKSVHCIECDVCVEEYDHHCIWTGKCIGKGNIRYFNFFIGSTVILLVYCIVVTVIYLGSKKHYPSS